MKKAFTLVAFLLATSICCAQESRTYQSASITVAGQFVTENSLNQVSPVTAGATSGVIGIATTSGPGVNLPVTVKWLGPAIASMDGACTVGQFVTISTTINGDGHCQSGLPTSTQALGIAEQNATGVVSILITPLSAQQTGSSGSMTWPAAAGIAVYAGGNAWGTSLTAPSSTIVGISDTQTLTNKSIAGSEVNSGTVPVAQIPTAIPIASVGSAGLSATLPIAITSAGAISTTSIAGFRFGNTSAADTVATAAQAATLIQGLTGCNTATYVFTPQASDCVAPSGGSAITYWTPYWNSGGGGGTFTFSSGNEEVLWGVEIPVALSIGHVGIFVTTDDATNHYSWGIFNSSGTAICTTTAATVAATGFNQIACSQGTVSIPAGKYYWGGTCAAGCSLVISSAAGTTSFYQKNTSFVATTGGAQPTSITPPSDVFILNDSQPILFLVP